MANFNLDDYVQVNERIEKFYEKYPDGSIEKGVVHIELRCEQTPVCYFTKGTLI